MVQAFPSEQPHCDSWYKFIGGGCGRSPVEVSCVQPRGSLDGAGGAGARGAALLLGRMSFRGLVERMRPLEGAATGDHFGVATSVLVTGRGIFLGWGGRSAATQRPEALRC